MAPPFQGDGRQHGSACWHKNTSSGNEAYVRQHNPATERHRQHGCRISFSLQPRMSHELCIFCLGFFRPAVERGVKTFHDWKWSRLTRVPDTSASIHFCPSPEHFVSLIKIPWCPLERRCPFPFFYSPRNDSYQSRFWQSLALLCSFSLLSGCSHSFFLWYRNERAEA